MAKKKNAPYGAWRSPVTSEIIAVETTRFADAAVFGEQIYWIESRPREQGRNVIVRRRSDRKTEDVTPQGYNARTRAHEYGGGAFAVHGQIVYFVNFSDQRIYSQAPGQAPVPITPKEPLRYADLKVHPSGKGMVAVREDHRDEGPEPVNTLVWLDLESPGPGRIIAGGNDFYASPCFDPDGARIAFLTWNHPQMPWDGTELLVADFRSGSGVRRPQRIAGKEDESVFQPLWSRDGTLYFVSDRTGWWNLYQWNGRTVEPLCPMQAEFGQPQWVFGMASYGVEPGGNLAVAFQQDGRFHLARLHLEDGTLERLDIPHRDIWKIAVADKAAVLIAGAPTRPMELVAVDLSTAQVEVICRSSAITIDPAYLSTAEPIAFPTNGGLVSHGFYYPPRNGDYQAPKGQRPPLLVFSHGGPTFCAGTTLKPEIQYWTSRGIAVVDVNYGGSSGYGRAYRERLKGQWGVVDVADCVNAAEYLIGQGKVDPKRIAIRGGSAGGYTTLAALTFHDLFRAGASYYGVSDLEALAKETHKFESRYLDSIVGPYPQRADLYRARSPIHFADRLTCPIIFFQGLDDRVVPPNQAELMFEALKTAGYPTAYIAFEGEDHGFRKAENIKRALDAELYFYSRVFGFEPADEIEPVEIENL